MSRVTLQDLRSALRDGPHRALTELVIHAAEAVYPVVDIHELHGALALEIAPVELGEYEDEPDDLTAREMFRKDLEEGKFQTLQDYAKLDDGGMLELEATSLLSHAELLHINHCLEVAHDTVE